MRNEGRRSILPLFVGFLVVFVCSLLLGIYLGRMLGESGKEEVGSYVEMQKEAGKEEIAQEETPTPSPDELPEESLTFEPSEEEASGTPAPEESPRVEPLAEQAPSPTPQPHPTISERKVASLPRVEDMGIYTVQVGSFSSEDAAMRLERRLKSSGYPAFIKKTAVAGKGTWYRVRVGTFKTREEATAYGEALKSSEPGVKAIFVTINN
jgi:cell division septation protein DedD